MPGAAAAAGSGQTAGKNHVIPEVKSSGISKPIQMCYFNNSFNEF